MYLFWGQTKVCSQPTARYVVLLQVCWWSTGCGCRGLDQSYAVWQKCHSLPILLQGVKVLPVSPGSLLLWISLSNLTARTLYISRLCIQSTNSFSFHLSLIWFPPLPLGGHLKNLRVQDLHWGLLPCQLCWEHLEREATRRQSYLVPTSPQLLSMRGVSGQFNSPSKALSS